MNITDEFDDEERFKAALDQVILLVVLFNEDMTKSLARDGLTVSRTHLLWELKQRGPTTQRELAEALGVSARNITGLVDGLVSTGFVTRQPHPTDRRATLVSFTEQGAKTVGELESGQRQLSRSLFAGMAPERFDHFVGGLGEVLARLHEELAAEAEREREQT
jgi:DNA-binding MarR family transcriptional regulator